MEVAITGASGLLGSGLAASLRDDGHVVRPLVRSPSSDPEAIRWDPADGTIEAAKLEGIDAVVHFAGVGIGEHRWTEEHKRAIRETRTQGTALIARTIAGLDAPPKLFLSGSAVGYYGSRGDDVLTEESGPGEGFLADLVGLWEQAADPAREARIRTAFLRTGIVLSRRGGVFPRLRLLTLFGLGGRLGSGQQWMSWISGPDMTAALRFLLETDGISGPVNVVGPQPVRNRDFAAQLGKALHRPTFLPTPAFGPRLVIGREKANELLFVSQRAQPTVLEAQGFTFRHPDIDSGVRAALEDR